MDEEQNPPPRLLRSLLESVAKAAHSFGASLVVSITALLGSIASFVSSDAASTKLELIVVVTGAFFAVELLAERVFRKHLLVILHASATMKVVLDRVKKRSDAAKEVALSLTYLSHLKRRHYSLKAILLVSAAVLALLSLKFPAFDLLPLASIPVAFVALILLKELVVEYRIRNGFFGTTQSEARELIKFLVNNSSDIDFTDSSGKLRRTLLPELEPQTGKLSRPSSDGVVA